MNSKKRSTGFILAILCTFTLLLTACGANKLSSTSHSAPHRHTKLSMSMAVDPTMTTTASATTTATTSSKAMYVGQVPGQNAWVGLAANSGQASAFVTDGSKNHPATFAQWFKGPVTNNRVNLTASSKSGTDRLQATLSNNNASGTVTLAGGKSFPFTAQAVSPSEKDAGLYRGSATINGVPYTAGWVVVPRSAASPSPTGTPTMSVTGTATTSPMASPTESATGTATASSATALPQGGAIINQKTDAVQSAPELTPQDISAKNVTASNGGSFKLMQCEQSMC
jgi:hypothetical protein